MISKSFGIGALLLAASLLILSPSLPAQVPSSQEDRRVGRVPKIAEDRDQLEREPVTDLDLRMQALEAAIDPQAYIVGPGDEFLINVQSSLETRFRTIITPEGKLIVPTIGTFFVDGMTLAEVQKLVREAGSKKYLRTTITANLVRLRTFRVHVTGQVESPGPYLASAVTRVSDIIEEAGGLTSWAYERAVEVRHVDGAKDTVDLHRYRKLGDLSSNVFLRGGDVIHVPSIDLAGATVRVEGLVDFPGTYQLSPGETLEDFLLRVNALNRGADLRHAYIERRRMAASDGEVIPIFPYLNKRGNGHSGLALEDGDVIMVPERKGQVYVIGAVRNPGPYPFIPNLKVRDYVGLAGGTEQAVPLKKVKLVRRGSRKEKRGPELPVEPGDTVYVPQKVKFGVVEAVTIVGQLTGILIALKAVGVIK